MDKHKHALKEKRREQFYQSCYFETVMKADSQPFIPAYEPTCSIKKTILSLILNSGEIPSDIYKQLDIKPGTFRAKITLLHQEGLICRNFNDTVHTYLLSAGGRKCFKTLSPYVRTATDIKTRLRHIKLARLNACLEGLNVTTFLEMNPPLKNIAKNELAKNNWFFYNSYYLKPTVSENSLCYRRSKAMGILIGYENAFMVYYSPYVCDFYNEERLFSEFTGRYINKNPDEIKMIIAVDTLYQAAYWLYFLLDHSHFFNGESPLRLFRKVQFLVLDSYAGESFELLHREKEYASMLTEKLNAEKLNLNDLSFVKMCGGDKELYFFIQTLDFSRIRYVKATAEYGVYKTVHIITTQHLLPVINALLKDTKIILHYI